MTAQDCSEPILEPELPIVDAHHHLWFVPEAELGMPGHSDDPTWGVVTRKARYLLDEFLADVKTGHNIRATVYAEGGSMYRAHGSDSLKSLGEVEFVNGIAAMAASGLFGDIEICAGIIGYADLSLGDAVEEVLKAHLRAAGARYCGVRNITASDSDTGGALCGFSTIRPGILLEKSFRDGFRRLQEYALSFDAIVLEPQLPEVIDLARTFPDTTIILNHVGMPVNISSYAGKRDERFRIWDRNVRMLAKCPNVTVKLGGLGQAFGGFKCFMAVPPMSSSQIATEWRPYIETCIEVFGAQRCMFESNFPVDSGTCSYPVLWNAFKHIASGASPQEKDALFAGTAARVYRLDLVDQH